MGMLNQEDLRQIGALLDEKHKVLKTEIVEQVGEMLEFNVLPQFDRVNERIDKVEAAVESLQTTVATLPTKDYIDEKLGGARGKFNLARRGAGI